MSISPQEFSGASVPIQPPVCVPQQSDAADLLLAKLLHIRAGGSGVKVVANTATYTDRTIGFRVIATAVFATAVADSTSDASVAGLTGVSLPAGLELPLRLESWSLTSGTVAAILA